MPPPPPPPTQALNAATVPDVWEVYYTCQCAGSYQRGGMCSHIVLLRHLVGEVNLDLLTQTISAPRMRGRPTKAVAALQKEPAERRFPQPSYYVGAGFAKMFATFHSQPFVGTVVDIRRPNGVNTVHEVLYKISYAAQLGFPESFEEEVYEALLGGIQLFKTIKNPVTAQQAGR